MDSKKITTNRGIYVILLILVIISSIILINVLRTNKNFDNERLTSKTFRGSLTIESQPLISLQVYFDGFGNINGSIGFSNDTFTYSGDYICLGEEVQFSFTTSEPIYQFTFLGNLLSGDSVITGDVRFYKSSTDIFNGTFYISLL